MRKVITIIIIAITIASCGSTSGLCPAYSQETSQEQFYASLDCQNCDEVD